MKEDVSNYPKSAESFGAKLKRKAVSLITSEDYNTTLSYSQAGEDRIIFFLFCVIDLKNPTYLDIGANKPKLLSNTYFFYYSGSRGVCIEPNPPLWEKFKEARPRDITLNVGVGSQTEKSLPFYCFGPEADGLSTFSEEQARQSEELHHHRIKEILQVPVVTINSLLEKYFSSPPSLLSIDVEGLDQQILESLDFERHAPIVICAETHFREGNKLVKDQAFINFVKSKGYMVFADTHINTIFVKAEVYAQHFG